MGYVWLILVWVIYLALHSGLAAISVKDFFYSQGVTAKRYRFGYNMIAVVGLIPIILIASSIPKQWIFESNNYTRTAGLILSGYGVVLGKVAFKSYNTSAFLGLGNMDIENTFTTKGMLKKVRHPLYLATLLIIVGYLLFHPTYASCISGLLLTIYIFIGIRLEERKLIRQFGDRYRRYREQTPMLLPKLWN